MITDNLYKKLPILIDLFGCELLGKQKVLIKSKVGAAFKTGELVEDVKFDKIQKSRTYLALMM